MSASFSSTASSAAVKTSPRSRKALEPEYSSLLVDLPNHGDLDWTDEFNDVDMADSIAAMIAEATSPRYQPVHLVGHSLGGKTAMVVARVILNSSTVSSSSTSPRLQADDIAVFKHLLSSLAELDLDQFDSGLRPTIAAGEYQPEDTIKGDFCSENLPPPPAGYAWQPYLTLLHSSLPKIGDFPDTGEVTFIPGPVLWIAGEKSDYVSRATICP